jgi:predicted transcriptional regulator
MSITPMTTTTSTVPRPATVPRRTSGLFVTTQDPVVGTLQYAIQTSGLTAAQIAAEALCSWQTVQRVVDGASKQPRNSTVERILLACGVTRKLFRRDSEGKSTELDLLP